MRYSNLTLLFVLLVGVQTADATQSASVISVRQQTQLTVRIKARAQNFQTVLTKILPKSAAAISASTYELIESSENLSLLIDAFEVSRLNRDTLSEILRAASTVERQLIIGDVSPALVITWASLHSDLNILAKSFGVKWTEAVVTPELIAGLENQLSDLEGVCVQAKSESSNSALGTKVKLTIALPVQEQILDLNRRVRTLSVQLKGCVLSSLFEKNWRQLSANSHELVRLLSLDQVTAPTVAGYSDK